MEAVEPRFIGTGDVAIETVAELWTAEGRPMSAVEWIRSRVPFGDDRIGVDTVVTLARALADVAQSARDTDDRQAERRAVEELARWVDSFRESSGELGDTGTGLERVNRLIAAAEVARCRNDPDELDRWDQVVGVCDAAGLRWYEACALCRLAEAAVRRNSPHALIAATVRRLHELAAAMGAVPLRERAERLARVARVSLLEPAHIPAQSTRGTNRPELLTAREREVLGHLVAGRTNTEIAASLFISDKTVSVHVSNILRKTGTAGRVEAAAWAVRQT
jgi:DNA-binding CsgD family transcriptional regulator